MTWVAVAIGGAALIGGAASYAGSKKQSDAANKAANISQGQYQSNVGMQQPYVQSGYGAMSKLNTLLGINPDPNAPTAMPSQPVAPNNMTWNGPGQMMENAPQQPPEYRGSIPTRQQPNANPQLRQILQIRADNGDPQAKQMLGMIQ